MLYSHNSHISYSVSSLNIGLPREAVSHPLLVQRGRHVEGRAAHIDAHRISHRLLFFGQIYEQWRFALLMKLTALLQDETHKDTEILELILRQRLWLSCSCLLYKLKIPLSSFTRPQDILTMGCCRFSSDTDCLVV